MSTRSKAKTTRKDEILIPDKLYFRIGEVSTLCRLPAYVLRFWETEFSQLKPVKSSTGQRMYRRKEVETVLRIKQLLYEEGFTIAGALSKPFVWRFEAVAAWAGRDFDHAVSARVRLFEVGST